MPSAIEIAQGRSAPLSAGIFEAIQTSHPLFSAFDMRTSASDNFLTLARVSLPTSGFKNLGEGFTASDAKFALREFSCSLIGGKVQAELISMQKWNRNHPGLDWWGIQVDAKMTADILHLERQIIRGLSHDAKGFPGAKDMTPFITGNVLAMTDTPDDSDFTKTVVNVAGTTANTASSAYSFVFGPMQAQLVMGGDSGGELFEVGEPIRQFLAPDANAPTETSEHMAVQIHGWVGLSISGFNQSVAGQTVPTQYSVRRAANITADSGKGMTDKVMEKLAVSHGTGVTPSLFAMSARSADQLAASRNATAIHVNLGGGGNARNYSGSINPMRPREWEGIPIAIPQPNVIGNTDAIEAV